MNARERFGYFGAALMLCLLVASFAVRADSRVSRPFEYKGYSEPIYEGVEKFSAYVPMSDGEKIAIDVYYPAGQKDAPFPVILEITPYTRAFVDVKNGPLHKMARKSMLGTDSPNLDLMAVTGGMASVISDVISRGYIFVRADIRGCGASTGWKADFMPQIGKDGGELVDWIGEQPWCTGAVGMVGGSYSGYTQIVTAGHAGPALKAIAPVVVPMDGYHGQVYPGGIYAWKFMHDYSKNLFRLNLNHYDLYLDKLAFHPGRMMLPAAPVIDEDGDGDLYDEIPVDLNRNNTFLDDYNYPADPNDQPRYADGQKREHIYYLATRDHMQNVEYHQWAQGLLYIDAKLPSPFNELSAYDFSPSTRVKSIMEKGVAIYNVGGWHDTFARGTTEYFCTLRETNPSRLMMHPGYHGGGGPYWKMLVPDDKKFFDYMAPEMLRFFDFYLKGIDNGFDQDPPIQIFVQRGEGWRGEYEWPLAREERTKYYFDENRALSAASCPAGEDSYKADFTHDSRYGQSLGNRYLGAMGVDPDALPVRTQKDKQCLTYTSAPLAEDTEVTGHPIVDFWVASSAKHGDFFVYLEDVAPDGEVVLVTEGLLRAGFAGLVDNDEMISGGGTGVDVKPDLPWHGFEAADYVDEIFKDGNVVELKFDLKPTSWVFKKGHAIRVSIACADWPTFRLHPRLAPDNNPKNPLNIVPNITVHRSRQRPSNIDLPVIPQK